MTERDDASDFVVDRRQYHLAGDIAMFSRRDIQRICVYSLLVIPFAGARLNWEPYPAIILPAGASLISQNQQTIDFQSPELWAIDQDGGETSVDIGKFLGRIPRHFWNSIAKRELGYAIEKKSRGKSSPTGSEDQLNGDPGQRAEMAKWIHKRLAACGIEGAVAVNIKWSRRTLNIVTGETVEQAVVKESHVSLVQS